MTDDSGHLSLILEFNGNVPGLIFKFEIDFSYSLPCENFPSIPSALFLVESRQHGKFYQDDHVFFSFTI